MNWRLSEFTSAEKNPRARGASGGLAGAGRERYKAQNPPTLNFQFQQDQTPSKNLLTEHPFRLIPGLENTATPPCCICSNNPDNSNCPCTVSRNSEGFRPCSATWGHSSQFPSHRPASNPQGSPDSATIVCTCPTRHISPSNLSLASVARWVATAVPFLADRPIPSISAKSFIGIPSASAV